MSIHDSLRDVVTQGWLIRVEPKMPSEPMVRALYASAEVHRLIVGPWADSEEEIRCGRLWADFDRFVEGRVIPVALSSPYSKPRDTYLSRLDPAHDEVWEIRSRAPKPAIRVFGRFADRDCFVALRWKFRKELGGQSSNEFRHEVRGCLADWRRIFPSYDAFRGNTVDEYISEKVLPV